MFTKVVLVVGANGMDGSHACDYWLEQGYVVHGTVRRSSTVVTERIDHIAVGGLVLHHMDVTDAASVLSVINQVRPTMILNFSAQSHVFISSQLENYTVQTNTIGVLNILQAVRILGLANTCRIYQASTSEQFGNVGSVGGALNEMSLQKPVSVYGISKLAAQQLCNLYRDAFNMFVVSALLFNHESERRGHDFVTQKIAIYVGKFRFTPHNPLKLGNLNARRDWGHARDYVKAIYLMMHAERPDNYVIATGESHSVREFAEVAFACVGIKLRWEGTGLEERGVDGDTGATLVVVDPDLYRDVDIDHLCGDATKAKETLGWTPTTKFRDLVGLMVDSAIGRYGLPSETATAP